MIDKVISGGQTGVDQAALRAARACGIPTGGLAPKGWRTEAGPAPWLAGWGLAELPTPSYAKRTRANADAATATLILVESGAQLGGGTGLTLAYCQELATDPGVCKPYCLAMIGHPAGIDNAEVLLRLHFLQGGTLNVAGPRESKFPGIGNKAEAFLVELFDRFRRAIESAA